MLGELSLTVVAKLIAHPLQDHARVPFACFLNCIRMSALAGDDSAPSVSPSCYNASS